MRYMAFGHPPVQDAGYFVGAGPSVLPTDLVMSALMRSYSGLHVAYAIVPPEALAEAHGPFPEYVNPEAIERFVAAYDGGRGPLGPWRCGAKEYYEVPQGDIWRLGGLDHLIGGMERFRVSAVMMGRLDYQAQAGEGGKSVV